MKKYCKAFILLLLALIPAACSDQMDLAEQKMQEIAGDYLLTGLSDRKTSYLPLASGQRAGVDPACPDRQIPG